MYGREPLGRVIVIKTARKSNGAVGSRRKGNSGKTGWIYAIEPNGKRKELACVDGSTFSDVSKKLRETSLVPTWVAIKSHEDTHY
mgnify:CR=1 FL=1